VHGLLRAQLAAQQLDGAIADLQVEDWF